jgi:hypothetical protein
MNSGGLILMLRQTSFCLAVLKIPDVPSDPKGSAVDDVEDKGTTLAETLIPSPIGTDVPRKSKPSATDRALLSHPLAGVAKNAYVPLLNGPSLSLKLIR